MLSQIPLLIPLLRFIIKLDEIFTKKFPGMIVSSKLGNFPLDIIPRVGLWKLSFITKQHIHQLQLIKLENAFRGFYSLEE
ncbi:unnamed protein product [Rhizophagus irregularis]|nr:unnamed protein product [Rhizophagus irregularis]